MGSGRTFSRPSSRLRIVGLGSVFALFVFYLILPHSFDSDSLFSLTPSRPRVQFDFRRRGVIAADPGKAARVKETMKDTFWKYREAAWGMDEVRPISGGNSTSRNGWAATLMDTLTTTLVMGLEKEFMLVLSPLGDTGDRG
jgi:mannosyl-oligosaccharide alpha-1,2-mannosidase